VTNDLNVMLTLLIKHNTCNIDKVVAFCNVTPCTLMYVGVLISLWLFLFVAQPKEFFLDWVKKLEQRSHKCLELREEYVE
jgi:hypothetical protein